MHPSILPEEEFLLARCLRWDGEALETLAGTYGTPLHVFICLISSASSSRNQNILVNSMADALKKNRPFDGKIPFLTLAAKFAVAEMKGMKNEGIPSCFENSEPRLQCLAKTLSKIKPEEKMLLLLRDQLLLSIWEIAYVLAIPESEVIPRLAEARLHFNEILGRILASKEGLC